MEGLMDEFYGRLDQAYAQGGIVQAEQFLLEYVEKPAGGGPTTCNWIAAYNELGSLYRGSGRYGKSLWAFERAESLAAKHAFQGSAQYATILNNMAGTYRLMKEHHRAIALFSEAIALYRQEGLEESDTFASVLNNLSLAYRETGETDKAIACLEQALAIIEQMPGQRREIAVTYHNLAALYQKSGKEAQAMSYLDRALDAFEHGPMEARIHYAAALNSLAGMLYAQGDYPRAIETYCKSACYTKHFFGENEEYGITWKNMAWVYEKMGEPAQAIAALEKAEQIYRQLLGANHERTQAAADNLKRLREASGG